jgi:hypothetical protein
VRAALIYADRRTGRRADVTQLTGAFGDYANAPKESASLQK